MLLGLSTPDRPATRIQPSFHRPEQLVSPSSGFRTEFTCTSAGLLLMPDEIAQWGC